MIVHFLFTTIVTYPNFVDFFNKIITIASCMNSRITTFAVHDRVIIFSMISKTNVTAPFCLVSKHAFYCKVTIAPFFYFFQPLRLWYDRKGLSSTSFISTNQGFKYPHWFCTLRRSLIQWLNCVKWVFIWVRSNAIFFH